MESALEAGKRLSGRFSQPTEGIVESAKGASETACQRSGK